jgi:membrane-bound lytic murein transglycosylase D
MVRAMRSRRPGGLLSTLCALAFAVPTLATAVARADDATPRPAGLQDELSRPVPAVRAPLSAEARERTAIRGCPVDGCARWQDELREFELEAFAPAGGPWLDGEARPAPGPHRRVDRPSELRPDLPWLDDLVLPDLPVVWDRRVIDYLVFYKDDPRGRRLMRGWLERQGRYRDLIVSRLRAAHLPEDLLYVAMIESSYDPSTTSRVGAGGLWQFMPGLGRVYGLAIDRWVDERSDPVRGTDAAIANWIDLYQRFGDWHLAIAAYNAGFGAVLKGIARFNTNDFWQLVEYENALPWESSIYVPKAIAAAIVGHNRALFGYGDLKESTPEAWDDVEVPVSLTLAVVAKAAGCSVDDVRRLNPQLRRNRTPVGRSFVLRVPAGDGRTFAARLGELRGEWDQYDTYVVAHGERFEDVATQFGLSRSRLRELNDISDDTEITGGTMLVVPRISEVARKANLEKARDELYGSGVDHRPGELLIVAVPDKDADVDGKRRVFYRVVAGDSLTTVARAMDVKVGELASWNGIAPTAGLQPRMVLQAWVPPAWSEQAAHVALLDETRLVLVTRGSKEHLELSEQRSGRERFEYTAKKAESFETIGKKYGLGKRDVARINRLPPDTVVAAGQTIVLYRVIDPKRSERAEKQWKKTPRDAKKKPPPAKGRGRADRTHGTDGRVSVADGDAGDAGDERDDRDDADATEVGAKDRPTKAAKAAKDVAGDGPVTSPAAVDPSLGPDADKAADGPVTRPQ